jgi:hypothetical protein
MEALMRNVGITSGMVAVAMAISGAPTNSRAQAAAPAKAPSAVIAPDSKGIGDGALNGKMKGLPSPLQIPNACNSSPPPDWCGKKSKAELARMHELEAAGAKATAAAKAAAVTK